MDDAANFSASVDDGYSWLYPVKGLLGGYWGFFSLFPYHRKIQEYTNYESRDLWEYDLKLSAEQVRFMELMLWELGSVRIRYYYLHQNCSYVMLGLLEAAAPELELTKHFDLYAIPGDTLRAVTMQPGIVSATAYRPSAQSRYIMRLRDLAPTEVERLTEIIQGPPLTAASWQGCDPACQRRILDAAFEYFDFVEKLAGERTPEHLAARRQELLLLRARLGGKSPPLSGAPTSTRIDLGHGSSLVGLGGGVSTTGRAYGEFSWRPALQDLLASSLGYHQQMELQFLGTQIHKDAGSSGPYLHHLAALGITSLASDLPLVPAYAWNFLLGADHGYGFGRAQTTMRSFARAGGGKAWSLWSSRLMLYAMADVEIGHAASPTDPWHAGPALLSGGVVALSPQLKLVARTELARVYAPRPIDRVTEDVSVVDSFAQNTDVRIGAVRESGAWELGIAMRQYF